MPRHGLKYCLICNPFDNGMDGIEGTEAIGKYYLMPGEGQATYGWMPVCEDCTDTFDSMYEIVPIKGQENHPYFVKKREALEMEVKLQSGQYKHNWEKDNLVGQSDLTDWWKCKKCGLRAKRRMMVPLKEKGCTVSNEVNVKEGV